MKIIVEGPADSGKSNFIHRVLVQALRDSGYGGEFFFEGEEKPSMFLTGSPTIQVVERQTHA